MSTSAREKRREQIIALAQDRGFTVVEVATGPVECDDAQIWCEVRDLATDRLVYAYADDPAVVIADFVQASAAQRWFTTAEIDDLLDSADTEG